MIEVHPSELRPGDTVRVEIAPTNLGYNRAGSREQLRGNAEDLTIAEIKPWVRHGMYFRSKELAVKFTDGRVASFDDYTYNIVWRQSIGLPDEIVPDTRLLPEATAIRLSLEDFE